MKNKAYLLLADHFLLEGTAIGTQGTAGGEICFNTGMTGYQEIYTDPSYYGQIVVNTSPHIGNYGVIDDEQESDAPTIKGLVVNHFSGKSGCSRTLSGSIQPYLKKNNVVGIANVDTRMLVRHIRNKGSMNAIISSTLLPEEMKKKLLEVPSMQGLELASKVSTQKPYFAGNPKSRFKVAVLDLGVKKSILKYLLQNDSYCQVFPAKTDFATMQAWDPAGYFISNGPGDPSVMHYAIKTVKSILDANKPFFGICLGHQLLAHACDIPTYKMYYGHRGLNHPVKNLDTSLGEITSQNHGFSICEEALAKSPAVEPTHLHLNDHTIMGLKVKNKKAFSVQYHPEASPGPHDSCYLFNQFAEMMKS